MRSKIPREGSARSSQSLGVQEEALKTALIVCEVRTSAEYGSTGYG